MTRWLPLLLPLLLGGCLMSEQDGVYPEDVTFHFLSLFNVVILLVRVAVVAACAWFAVKLVRLGPVKQLPMLLAVGGIGLWFAWLLLGGAASAVSYRISVEQDGLHVSRPLRKDADVPWERIWMVYVEGINWTAQTGTTSRSLLPEGYDELHEMTIYTYDGDHVIDLERLSPEQRSNLFDAISGQAQLRDIELGT